MSCTCHAVYLCTLNRILGHNKYASAKTSKRVIVILNVQIFSLSLQIKMATPQKPITKSFHCERCGFAALDHRVVHTHIFINHHKTHQLKPIKIRHNSPISLYSCPDITCEMHYKSLTPNPTHSDHISLKDKNPRSLKSKDLPKTQIPNSPTSPLSTGPPPNLNCPTSALSNPPVTNPSNSPISPPPIHPPPPSIVSSSPTTINSPSPPPPIHPIPFGFIPQATLSSAPVSAPKFQIKPIYFNGRNKASWYLPPFSASKLIVIGDSNLNRIQTSPLPPSQIQIFSFGGARSQHIKTLLQNYHGPTQIDTLILSFGINDSHTCVESISADVVSIFQILTSKFSNTRVYFPILNVQPLKLTPSHLHFNQFLDLTYPLHTLPKLPSNFQTDSDLTHWVTSTADDMLLHWVSHL